MKKRAALSIYLVLIFISVLASLLLSEISKIDGGHFKAACAGINLGLYFIFGIILSRVVLRKLISWHPVNRTIRNIVSTKSMAIIFWPFYYPFLLVRLFIVDHL